VVKESKKLCRKAPSASQTFTKTTPTEKANYGKAPDDIVPHEKPLHLQICIRGQDRE
jgi:hypothetical protein